MSEESSPVTDFYNGCSILVTGATGFLGMGLLEKLLRSCPGVVNIFALMRSKKGKDVNTRLEELLKEPVFDVLREKNPDALKKVVAVSGDVSDENLGISEEDRSTLVEKISIVFHCAATLDFEASLKQTVNVNLLGTRRVVQLCHNLPKLKVLVHVSSAYVNCTLRDVEEVLYPPPGDAENVIQYSDSLSDQVLEQLTPKLLGDHPNTYTFTKTLAEHEVVRANSTFPVTIVRPSMITAAREEPMPGWISSMNGPSGFIFGAGKGIIRRLPMPLEQVTDYIPVDVVINQLILSGWHAATTRPETVSIFHCTTSTQKPFRWGESADAVNSYLKKYPLKSAVWTPHLKFLPSFLLFRISAIFVHFLPGYFLDLLSRLSGRKPLVVRLHKRVNESLGRLKFFVFTEWKFHNKNSQALVHKLSVRDRELFDTDLSSLVWIRYFEDFVKGVRRYLHHEDDKTLSTARRKLQRLYMIQYGLQVGILVIVWWLLAFVLGSTMTASFCVPVLYKLLSFL